MKSVQDVWEVDTKARFILAFLVVYDIISTCPSGEIGIHVCLRSICLSACWFKSSLGHHVFTALAVFCLAYFFCYNGLMVKRQSILKTYHGYLDGKIKLKTYQKIGVLFLVVVISGFAGWVWEFSLAEIGGGFKHLYIKGGNLLPWLNLYAYGALLIMAIAYWFRKKPWLVFIISALATGLLELFAGWAVYTFGNGTRYWDYTKDWWGIGNINGFVCPLSATVFGIGALLLIYVLLPFCIRLAQKMSKRAFLTLAITLFMLVVVDDITNLTLKNLGLPTAMDFYYSLGWRYR